jgi:hypothetical protein
MRKSALLLLVFLQSGLSYAAEPGPGSLTPTAGQQVPVKAKPAGRPLVRATDGPQILEFGAFPAAVVEGEPTTLRWRVAAGPGGSPIENLEIISGTPAAPRGVIYGRLLLSGEYPTPKIGAGGRGRASYTLKVVDRAGKSASRTVEIVAEPLDSVLARLSGFALDLVTTVDGARRDHIATLGLENGGSVGLNNVMIYLYQAYAPLMLGADVPDGILAGNLNGVNIVPGHNEFRIGAALRSPMPPAGDRRGLSKLVVIVAKEYSPGVIDRILMRGLYDLVETRDGGGALYSVRLIKVGV